MLYTFEMANNHMGSVSHAKLIIDKFSILVKKYNLNASIKVQFRQLDTFIHADYKDSDLKYVKRFNETRLTKDQFTEIVNYVKEIYSPFKAEEISAKIAEMLKTKDIKADVEVIYQSIEGLHKACPDNLGDWYFTGDYPTPGGNRVVPSRLPCRCPYRRDPWGIDRDRRWRDRCPLPQ